MSNSKAFLQLANSPFKLRFFLLTKLPAAFFSGVKVQEADEQKCIASVPFKWLTQNPFRSTYFASLSMAAEMSTGILAMAHIYKRNPGVSMLVLKVQGEFFKKATGRTSFTCEDGLTIRKTIEEAILTGEGKTVTALSTGRNAEGEVVATFQVTWSFKGKKLKVDG